MRRHDRGIILSSAFCWKASQNKLGEWWSLCSPPFASIANACIHQLFKIQSLSWRIWFTENAMGFTFPPGTSVGSFPEWISYSDSDIRSWFFFSFHFSPFAFSSFQRSWIFSADSSPVLELRSSKYTGSPIYKQTCSANFRYDSLSMVDFKILKQQILCP